MDKISCIKCGKLILPTTANKTNGYCKACYERINKPRKPWLAGILSFVMPGLGHIYCGKAGKGIKLYILLLIVTTLSFLIATIPIAYLGVALFFITSATYILIIIDAIRISQEHTDAFKLLAYNKWYLYLLVLIISSFFVRPILSYATKAHLVKTYKLTSKGMQPTILQDDWIIVNKYIYKFSDPDRGDIIIFAYPKDKSKDFVQRVVGIGGDAIEIRDKQLYINSKIIHEDFIIHTDTNTYPSDKQPRDNFGPIKIPLNSLFVLGDNRDRSADSRFWGFVDRDSVKGKVSTIYWSWDKFNNRVRWKRIAKAVH